MNGHYMGIRWRMCEQWIPGSLFLSPSPGHAPCQEPGNKAIDAHAGPPSGTVVCDQATLLKSVRVHFAPRSDRQSFRHGYS